MSYPKTILTRTVRRAIMVVLITAFFVLAPVAILSTAGYRYSWAERRLYQTGVLSVDALPRDAAVFLDGKRVPQELPIRLRQMLPGAYTLRIEKNGMKPWEKQVAVESKKTTYIKNITLYADTLPILIVNEQEPIRVFSGSPDGSFLIFATQMATTTYDIAILDTATNMIRPLGPYESDEPPRVLWPSDGSNAAIQTTHDHTTTLTVINADRAIAVTTLRNLAYPLRLQWGGDTASPVLYAEDRGEIKKITERAVERAASLPPAALWFLTDNEAVWLFDTEKQALFPQTRPETAISISGGDSVNAIIAIDDERMILKTDQGIIVRRRNTGTEERVNASSLLFHAATGEWIAWSPWEVWTIYPDGNAVLLNRLSEATPHVEPLDDYGVLLLGTAGSLIAFNPGYYVSQTLFAGGSIEAVTVQKQKHAIFFQGSVGSQHGIFSLQF